jgi:hypothetical protein
MKVINAHMLREDTPKNRDKVKKGTIWLNRLVDSDTRYIKITRFDIQHDWVEFYEVSNDRRHLGVLFYQELFEQYWIAIEEDI